MLNIFLSLVIICGIYTPSPSALSSAEIQSPPEITLNYIEYNRGMSFPTTAQLGIQYPGHYDLTFHDVRMVANSFYPDDFIIPNAFFWPLFEGRFGDVLGAFTEPYYGIRIYHFFKKRPNLGFGAEFIHLKVFIPDEGEEVHITGEDGTGLVDERKSTKEYISSYNISHGVNHLSLSVVYRLMLLPSEKVPVGRIQPYASLSIGPCIPHPQLRLEGDAGYKAFSYQPKFGNFGFGVNLGARFQISGRFGFYMEYKFTRSFLNDMSFDNGEEGEFWTRFPSHHIAWGVSFIF